MTPRCIQSLLLFLYLCDDGFTWKENSVQKYCVVFYIFSTCCLKWCMYPYFYCAGHLLKCVADVNCVTSLEKKVFLFCKGKCNVPICNFVVCLDYTFWNPEFNVWCGFIFHAWTPFLIHTESQSHALSFTLSPLSCTHILHLSPTHMYTFWSWSWWITLAVPYSGTNTKRKMGRALKVFFLLFFLSFRTGESKREDLNLSTVAVQNVLSSSLFLSMMWMFTPPPTPPPPHPSPVVIIHQ